jgi:hypothetical protein
MPDAREKFLGKRLTRRRMLASPTSSGAQMLLDLRRLRQAFLYDGFFHYQ